jgi:hypothetical protein
MSKANRNKNQDSTPKTETGVEGLEPKVTVSEEAFIETETELATEDAPVITDSVEDEAPKLTLSEIVGAPIVFIPAQGNLDRPITLRMLKNLLPEIKHSMTTQTLIEFLIEKLS